MKTTRILASLALALTGTLALADQAPAADRAQVKAEAVQARAEGQQQEAASYETAPRVEHRKAPQSGLTRAQVKEETREYLREHPNRVAEEYEPFAN